MDKDYKLEVKIGDTIVINNTGGNYPTYTRFFDEARNVLVSQMGNSSYALAKKLYCEEVDATYDSNGDVYHLDEGVHVHKGEMYTVAGFAPHSGFYDDDEYVYPEILVLCGKDCKIRLFCNNKRYIEKK